MTLPRAECAPIVDELLALYPELNEATWTKGNGRVGHIAHGWYMRVTRGVQAVLVLEENGLATEAAPIRRSVIEHVIALKWLATEGNQILDTLKRGHALGAEKLRTSVVGADWGSVDLDKFEELLRELEDADRSHDNMLSFINRARSYGFPDDLPQYFSETAISHPSYQSAIAFWEVPSMNPVIPESVDQMGFCMAWLLTASLVFRDLFEPRLWEQELDDLVRRAREVDVRHRNAVGMKPFAYPQPAEPSAKGTDKRL